MLTPHTSAMFAVAGMLTADGRCKTLDSMADGYVRGESCGALMLESISFSPSSRTPEDPGDNAAAILTLCGSSVKQDGRSSRYAPLTNRMMYFGISCKLFCCIHSDR